MKKIVSIISLLALLGVLAPVVAQDSQPPAPTPAPVDCNTLKGKAKKDCKKAERKAKKDKKDK
ncbi:MAG: hypothetical protein U1F27_02455 [Turneriella sp.]